MEILVGLQPHSQLGGGLEELRQPQRGVSRDTALSQDDLIQPVEGDAEFPRRLELTDAERFDVFLKKCLVRVNGCALMEELEVEVRRLDREAEEVPSLLPNQSPPRFLRLDPTDRRQYIQPFTNLAFISILGLATRVSALR